MAAKTHESNKIIPSPKPHLCGRTFWQISILENKKLKFLTAQAPRSGAKNVSNKQFLSICHCACVLLLALAITDGEVALTMIGC
jgi:hypothetical protein